MIRVQMGDEHLVEVVVRDHVGGNVGHGPSPDVEQELVSIAEFDQPTRRRLATSCRRQPRATGGDPYLVLREFLGSRIVDIPIGCRPRRGLYFSTGRECITNRHWNLMGFEKQPDGNTATQD